MVYDFVTATTSAMESASHTNHMWLKGSNYELPNALSRKTLGATTRWFTWSLTWTTHFCTPLELLSFPNLTSIRICGLEELSMEIWQWVSQWMLDKSKTKVYRSNLLDNTEINVSIVQQLDRIFEFTSHQWTHQSSYTWEVMKFTLYALVQDMPLL